MKLRVLLLVVLTAGLLGFVLTRAAGTGPPPVEPDPVPLRPSLPTRRKFLP